MSNGAMKTLMKYESLRKHRDKDPFAGKRADLIIMDDFEEKRVNKFAPVAPYHIYQQFGINGYIPDVILLLAHDVVAKEEEYKETFSDPRWNNTTIIMDNSLVELKESVDIEMVQKAVEITAADVVVLPDVMGDGVGTAKAIIDNWQEWHYTFRDIEPMAVLHGPTIPQMVECCEMIIDAGCNPHWISIPRITEKGNFERSQHISVSQQYFPHAKVHLLGFSDYPWCDIFAVKHTRVSSIDSAVPVRAEGKWRVSQDVGPRDPKWFENVEFNLQMIENCRYVDQLINA